MYHIIPISKVKKEIAVPGDKSISHRALLISSLARGKTKIINFLNSQDTLATLKCLRMLNVEIKYTKRKNEAEVNSRGPLFDISGKVKLNAQESGTTIRLLSGILVAQKFSSLLESKGSLRKRPMKRITYPLRLMGGKIKGKIKDKEEYPPLEIDPTDFLLGINYKLPQASAQVKSAIMFASLFSKGKTKIVEPQHSRDHTERMLRLFGAKLKKVSKSITIEKSKLASPGEIFIPSDISSASFFIALGLLLKDSEILIRNVGLNPTRSGFLKVLKRMGANIKVFNRKNYFEPYGDVLAKSSQLKGVEVEEKEIPLMIDELPILMVCASFAKGRTIIKGLRELKVKETDRLSSMVYNLKKAGVDIKATTYKGDNWKVEILGKRKINSVKFRSFSDHRTAMSLIVFGMASQKSFYLDDVTCIDKSFPDFIPIINSLYG
ncbi:MAG: 3-phosphoshikimate 1-carboxyvinyltransferase [Candidatus Omnitrophota bacterium]|nr:MAG: 3-phosphoshikimate 1-carboxyvinyltransferase [Candidatus Omnitrophota bacterium]RKY37614.1 MAG: 3-phosphoshikimate 1-carboxyvinyltransferase [Candidatus Omnitrophota bacterium]RKY46091.1 MAG: 3-phosphoshikimate 1-carboxyvinyltransferase [Candidatus Omnitrophota bacterium]HDN86412.1 3-phosphoshikimate 1-carboxyvinyltransferase [Candidatus Omnitrophota bacterium]